jgi:phage/plasmid-associated DNA primase
MAAAWRRIGVGPPDAVRAATEEYLAEEDIFMGWVAEHCVTGSAHWGAGQRLWNAYKGWADRNNERAGTRKAFAWIPTAEEPGHPWIWRDQPERSGDGCRRVRTAMRRWWTDWTRCALSAVRARPRA